MTEVRHRPRVLIAAGEPSGDLHGAGVIRALQLRMPGARIDAIGGPRMGAAGAALRVSIERFAAFGLAEVAAKLPVHVGVLRRLRKAFAARAYDLVILIDYPGFHLRVAEAARAADIPVLYYIAPQLWAWHPGRARRFAAAVDRMAVVLPFEERALGPLGISAHFVGHPLLDRAPAPDRAAARRHLGIRPESRVLALFPGSRRQEVRRLWPRFREAARILLSEGHCDRVLVAGTAAGEYPDASPLEVLCGDPTAILAAADAALAKSGTTTLEAALADTPMAVAYRLHPITFAVARRLIKVRWISLVNLIAEREIVPEFLQESATSSALAEAVRPLLDTESAETRAQREGLRLVRSRLGRPGAADGVATMAMELLER